MGSLRLTPEGLGLSTRNTAVRGHEWLPCRKCRAFGQAQTPNNIVIPAKAGIQGRILCRLPWIPAFAGMTEGSGLYSARVSGRQTDSSGLRSAATPQISSTIAAPSISAAPIR